MEIVVILEDTKLFSLWPKMIIHLACILSTLYCWHGWGTKWQTVWGLKRIHCVFQWKWVWWLYQSKISRETELIGYLLERFTLGILSHNCGNWLSLKSVGQASRVETETGLLCYSLEAKFLLLWEEKVLARKALSWLDKAHTYNQGQFA